MEPEGTIVDPALQADGSLIVSAPDVSVAYEAKPPGNSITLSDGRVAVCRDALGKDQIDARKLIDGNADKFYFALFELCVLIDGEKLFVSDYESMKLKDVSALTILFDKINF